MREPYAHVLLTFGFDTAVSLTGIEMDLLLCPDWGIGAPRIRVYVNEEYDLAFMFSLPFVQPSQSSCDSLTTVHLSGDILSSSYHTFHIIVDLPWTHPYSGFILEKLGSLVKVVVQLLVHVFLH